MFNISSQNFMTDLNVVRFFYACTSIPFFLNLFRCFFLVVNPCEMFGKIENNAHLLSFS